MLLCVGITSSAVLDLFAQSKSIFDNQAVSLQFAFVLIDEGWWVLAWVCNNTIGDEQHGGLQIKEKGKQGNNRLIRGRKSSEQETTRRHSHTH